MPTYQLIYFSRSASDADGATTLARLRKILSVSRRNNHQLGVTGFLLFDKKWFVQILEGDRKAVSALYHRIQGDRRHHGVTLVEALDVEQRSFPDLAMGASIRTADREGVYVAHGLDGALDPTKLKASRLLALARDLAAFDEFERAKIRAPHDGEREVPAGL